MIGSKAAVPNSLSSAFRMTLPAKSSPLTSNSNPKTLSVISAPCTPWSPLTACRSASTATATASFSATIPTGPWPNNSPANNLPPSWDGLWKNSASNKSLPTLPRPKAASSAPGAPARTAWSANSASPTLALSTPPTSSSPASAPTTTNASPSPPARHNATSAPCLRASTSITASVFATSAWSEPTTSSPSAPTPSHSHPCPRNAALPVPPWNSPTASMAACLSLIGRFCFCRCPCHCWKMPIAALPLAPSGRKQKPRCPASTTSAAGPPLPPYPNWKGVTDSRCSSYDIFWLQQQVQESACRTDLREQRFAVTDLQTPL